MNSATIDIPNEDKTVLNQKKKFQFPLLSYVSSLMEKTSKHDTRKMIHSIKVGIALVLDSLLYLLNPLFKYVVVVFEFFAGATLSKGLIINRGVGTFLGGGLGCLATILADELGGIGNPIVVGTSVFIFGAAVTYYRLVPSIKKRYDYGFMIFILTFNLVAVSGVRADKVMEFTGKRLSTIGMGFAVCIFTSLLIFLMWASDEFHDSTASKFQKLAGCIEGCLEEYFRLVSVKETETPANVNSFKPVLHAKSTEESLEHYLFL